MKKKRSKFKKDGTLHPWVAARRRGKNPARRIQNFDRCHHDAVGKKLVALEETRLGVPKEVDFDPRAAQV